MNEISYFKTFHIEKEDIFELFIKCLVRFVNLVLRKLIIKVLN